MKKIIWLSDLHLDFISEIRAIDFFKYINELNSDYVLISGDIGTSENLIYFLNKMREIIKGNIYFVLGNHDFYNSSFKTVREEVKKFSDKYEDIKWLTDIEPVIIEKDLAIIGDDGWADARLGTPFESSVKINDFNKIEELRGLLIHDRVEALNKLGDKSAKRIEEKLNNAIKIANNIIIVTHVPPFKESSWYNNLPSSKEWLPWFASKVFGDVLKKIAMNNKDKRFLVLCGHTHGESDVKILNNLRVITPMTEYGTIDIKKIFDRSIFENF